MEKKFSELVMQACEFAKKTEKPFFVYLIDAYTEEK